MRRRNLQFQPPDPKNNNLAPFLVGRAKKGRPKGTDFAPEISVFWM